jgi:type I restriction enzyme, S subunit
MESFEISLPPLPEQKAIASVLSSLDDKIDLLHRQNKTLEAMAETLFRQWFVEEAQEDWEEVPLSTFADNIRDNVKVDDLSNHKHYVGLEHIPRKRVVLDAWGETGSLGSNKSTFKKYDILFGKLRSYFHKVVCAPINGVCSTDVLVIRPKNENWLPFCLFWFFSEDVVEHSDLGSGGTRMPRTNWEIVGGYKVPRPSNERIIEFDKIVRQFLEKMFENIDQIRTLEKLRDTLLPKLMSGEVRVAI